MTWSCAAITNGMTFYSDGTIAPCCMIHHSYRKPIDQAFNKPFNDLDSGIPPDVCMRCHNAEVQNPNIDSYRTAFNKKKKQNNDLQFVDIRNFNLCNAKCRTCGPYNSSQWAIELKHQNPIVNSDLTKYKDLIVNPNLQVLYYTGGEPFINAEHWDLLEELIKKDFSKNIVLHYNSNLSTLKYKNKDIVDCWRQFQKVSITASIDAVGDKFNYIRSGLNWDQVNNNLFKLLEYDNIKVTIGTTVSILNLWFISELLDYYRGKCAVILEELFYPDYLSLSTIPDELKSAALDELDIIEKKYNDKNKINFFRQQVENNSLQDLFKETITHTLYLDQTRQEKLFDLLPFKDLARKKIFYE